MPRISSARTDSKSAALVPDDPDSDEAERTAEQGQGGRRLAEDQPAEQHRARRRGDRDHDDASEGDDAAEEERARKALGEDDARERRDEDRADVDEHGGSACVDAAFARVQGDVVGAEPQEPAEHEAGPDSAKLGTRRPALAPSGGDDAA